MTDRNNNNNNGNRYRGSSGNGNHDTGYDDNHHYGGAEHHVPTKNARRLVLATCHFEFASFACFQIQILRCVSQIVLSPRV